MIVPDPSAGMVAMTASRDAAPAASETTAAVPACAPARRTTARRSAASPCAMRSALEGKAATQRIVARLESQGHMLGMPHSRQLGDGLRELRFTCEGVARRVTYVLDPDRRAVTLTTFRKQRNNERGEILRARRAQARHKEGKN